MLFLISAERPEYGRGNSARTTELRSMVNTHGGVAIECTGMWEGVPEMSILVWGINQHTAVSLARLFEQTAILQIDPTTNLTTVVPTDSTVPTELGPFNEVPESTTGDYTRIGTQKFRAGAVPTITGE